MTSDSYKNVAQSLMSLATSHLQPIKSTSLRSLPDVSTYSYQKQHQLKYLIWPLPDRKGRHGIWFRSDAGPASKGGQLSATSPSQNSVLSCKPFCCLCWKGTNQTAQAEREGESQTTNYSGWKEPASSLDQALRAWTAHWFRVNFWKDAAIEQEHNLMVICLSSNNNQWRQLSLFMGHWSQLSGSCRLLWPVELPVIS